jgi:hypothetical protein
LKPTCGGPEKNDNPVAARENAETKKPSKKFEGFFLSRPGGLGMPLGPPGQAVQHVAHIGAFTAGGTRLEFALVQAVSGTFIASRQVLFVNRSIVKIQKIRGLGAERIPAGHMIEKEKAEAEVVEIHLVSANLDVGIGQKVLPRLP